ncbi:MAG TPA: condensation domain-containing protein [Candidatus Acidoferrales bacterium]|nr:condensation domain-containing protein [Candidatus Acidoferrales bacterium]
MSASDSIAPPFAESSPEEAFVLPASFGQERFWGLDRLQPGNPTWMVPVRFRLQGPLNTDWVARAFNDIVRRHESLRTTFRMVEGQLMQVIRPSLTIDVPVADLRMLPKPDRDAEVDRLSFQEARRGFDLAAGPLFRVSLLRTEENDHVLLVTPHHAVADYWSVGLISNELAALYVSYARGSEPVLPELSVQYGDYAIWQREQAESAPVQAELAYWKRQLENIPLLDFPVDRPRPASPTYDATITSILLPVALTDAIRGIANREGATFFNMMLAALSVVLRQYTGQADFGVATQVAGRTSVELEPLIGLFINTVVLRMNLSGDPSFSEFLQRVQQTGADSIAHQNLRFERLLKELRPREFPSHRTLFRVNFICQRDPVKPLEFEGVKLTVIPSKCQGALYELNIFLVLRNEGWRLACEYNTGLFDAPTITNLLAAYRAMLEALVADPSRRLSEFPAPEAAKRLVAPPTVSEPPAIAAPAVVPPAAPASSSAPAEKCAMPASALQERFWLLQKLSPTNRAFYMPACVRLNGRISRETLEQAFQRIIERHETLRTTFELQMPAGELMQVISPAAKFSLPLTSIEDVPEPSREAELKKAIRRETGHLFDLSVGPLFRARLFRLRPEDHVLVVTIHHILSDAWSQSILQRDLWQAYEALSAGQAPALAPLPIQYADYVQWKREWLASGEARESLAFWTRQLADPLPVLNFPTDRPISERPGSHGEMGTVLLPQSLVGEVKSWSQSQEVTMFMLMLACFGVLLSRYTGQDDIVIGSPVANRRADTEGLIGPFAGPVALRMNLSGNPTLREILNRVRDTTLDTLSHAGTPFEVILQHLNVRSVNHRNPLFQFYFFYQTAFLQPRELPDLTVTPMSDFSLGTPFELQFGLMERKEGVRAQLEYNPDIFDAGTIQEILDFYVTMLRSLISNPNQRLGDLPVPARRRAAYEAPAAERPTDYVAPRTSPETHLVLMWQRLLGQERVGIRDSFFALGGTSLIAARMANEVEKAFNRRIELSTLIIAPTIEQLVRYVTEEGSEYSSVVPIKPSGSRPPLFCVHGGGGHVLRFRAMAARLDPDQPFYGLRSPEFDGASAQVTVEDLAARYIRDIRRVQPHGPYHLSGASFGGLVAFEMASQLAAQGEQTAFLALFDTGNHAHYRNLPFSDSLHFRTLYVLDRLQTLGKKIARMQFRELALIFWESFRTRASFAAWRMMRRFYRSRQRELPKAFRDNVKLFEAVAAAYTPRPYAGPMLLFRAQGRTAEYGNDPALGWDDVITGGVEIIQVPGDHMTILEEPYVWTLVEQLGAYLQRASAGSAKR